ncbi:MAG: hypothetical protein F6K42_07835 [Leptolyngbya sp. SIO1D8]|nr:hypothetical protein [Leptolyngbya sp. SIO1D8]
MQDANQLRSTRVVSHRTIAPNVTGIKHNRQKPTSPQAATNRAACRVS